MISSMKKAQLAAVVIIVLLVAAVGAFYVFSDKHAGEAARTLSSAKFGTQPTYPTQPGAIGGPPGAGGEGGAAEVVCDETQICGRGAGSAGPCPPGCVCHETYVEGELNNPSVFKMSVGVCATPARDKVLREEAAVEAAKNLEENRKARAEQQEKYRKCLEDCDAENKAKAAGRERCRDAARSAHVACVASAGTLDDQVKCSETKASAMRKCDSDFKEKDCASECKPLKPI